MNEEIIKIIRLDNFRGERGGRVLRAVNLFLCLCVGALAGVGVFGGIA